MYPINSHSLFMISASKYQILVWILNDTYYDSNEPRFLNSSEIIEGDLMNPLPVGSREKFVLSLTHKKYNIAVVVQDENYNESPLSDVIYVDFTTAQDTSEASKSATMVGFVIACLLCSTMIE